MIRCDCCDPVLGSPSSPSAATMTNIGAGAQIYSAGTSIPFELRTITCDDGSLVVSQTATTVNIVAADPTATMNNLGAGAQIYDAGSSNPFDLRTITCDDGSLVVSQTATTVNIVAADPPATMTNIGAGTQLYSAGTSDPFEIKTLTSTGGTVTITSTATTVNLEAAGGGAVTTDTDASAATNSTTGTAYVTVWTSSVSNIVAGEDWFLWVNALVFHPSALFSINTRLRWQIETGPGTFTTLEDNINVCWPMTLGGGQLPTPCGRFYRIFAALGAITGARVRLQMSMSAASGSAGVVGDGRYVALKVS